MPPLRPKKLPILLAATLSLTTSLQSQEIWSFEEDPSQAVSGAIALEPLPRSNGNVLQPADPEVATQTGGQHALSNPALMFDGDLTPVEIDKKSWTLSGWFRNVAESGTMTGVQTLAGTRQSPSRFKGWDLNMVNGTLRFLSSPPRDEGRQFATTKRYDDRKWHFFQLVWDANAREVTLYVDGEKVGSAQDVPFNIKVPGRTFTIGAKLRDESRATCQEWDGEIDEWKFEPSAVTEPMDIKVSQAPRPQSPSPPLSASSSTQAETATLRLLPLPGQLALTWREKSGDFRTVLASYTPITEANRASARTIISNLSPGSANDWYEDPKENPKPALKPQGWKLTPEGPNLDREDGAFVYTFQRDDPAELYFAVVADGESIKPGENATTTPTRSGVASIQPIPQSPEVVAQMKNVRLGLPVFLILHAHTSRPAGALSHLFFGDSTMGWRGGLPFKFKVSVEKDRIVVEPYDRVWINRKLTAGESSDGYDNKYRNIESWWYGTNDKINSREGRKQGVAVNYTERWLLWMLDWVVANYQANPDQIYAFGTSMGSGIQRLTMANPDRFASVDVLVPFVDWTYVDGRDSNARRLQGACGPMSMPTAENKPLADRMNLVKVVSETKGDLPFVVARMGRNDRSVFWPRKPAYLRAMNANHHGLLARWDAGDHSTGGRAASADFPTMGDTAWYLKRFALNKSYLALSDFSLNNDYGDGNPASGEQDGFVNRGLDWEIVADEPSQYQARLFGLPSISQFPVTCSITPRRLQNFTLSPGEKVLARITDTRGQTLSEQTLIADEAGRITVPAVSLPSVEGVTLTLQKNSYVKHP